MTTRKRSLGNIDVVEGTTNPYQPEVVNNTTLYFSSSFKLNSFETEASRSVWVISNEDENQWVIGTYTASAGTYSAYVSNNGGTDWTYNGESPGINEESHIYIEFTVLSGSTGVNASYQLAARGEGTVANDYDNLRVYCATASATAPTAGALPTGYTLLNTYVDILAWTATSESLDTALGLPKAFDSVGRFIFTAKTDGSVTGDAPLGAFDEFYISNAFVLSSSISSSIVTPEADINLNDYDVYVGTNYDPALNTSGSIADLFIKTVTSFSDTYTNKYIEQSQTEFAEIMLVENTSATALTVNSWANINGTFTEGSSSAHLSASGNFITILPGGEGIYQIDYSGCYFDTSADDNYEVGISVNNQTPDPNHHRGTYFYDFVNYDAFAGSSVIKLDTNSNVRISLRNTDATNNVGIYNLKMAMRRIGNYNDPVY